MDPSKHEAGVRELTPHLLGDWLAFFDRDAFADNPEWASCYCHFYHADHSTKDWDDRSAAENRAASSGLIDSGRLRGYLAYVDGKPVGWCQAAPRILIRNIENDEDLAVPDAQRVGSIVCFVVAEPYRRQGVAHELLEAACNGFRRQGLAIAEAYPRLGAETDAANYHGPLSLYLESGFATFRTSDRFAIVRRTLIGSETV